jgi:hypothetical protein
VLDEIVRLVSKHKEGLRAEQIRVEPGARWVWRLARGPHVEMARASCASGSTIPTSRG